MASETRNDAAHGHLPLPEFENPPLFETVFGVRFPRLANWDIPHFGLFWERLREGFPHFEVHRPIFGPGARPGFGDAITLELATRPEVRCWFLGPQRNHLVQVQNDGFFLNWRKVTLDEIYPRYEHSIRPTFLREWERFRRFLADEDIGAPEVVECEATYVNHFVKGREWSSVKDLHRLLQLWAEPPGGVELPKAVRINSRFEFGNDVMDVNLVPVVRREDGAEILQFDLSVRGRPDTSDASAVMTWMDRARANIVRTFTKLTTSELHKLWKRVK